MTDIVVGPSLTVRIALHGDHPHGATASASDVDVARVAIRIADPARADALAQAIANAIAEATVTLVPAMTEAERAPVVRLRARKAIARDPARLAGAIAVVPVTARNARHLVALIDGVLSAGALGIQLVWDGAAPPRADVERHVFAALEHARATPTRAPVVLASSERPATALHVLIAQRARL